ncbi:MAG: hypothetical protein U0Q12_02185 [Vicinamibacterales bacterium]
MATVARLLAASLTLVALGCGSKSPTVPTAAVTLGSEFFADTLSPQSSAFYSFVVTDGGTVSLTLASVTGAAGQPVAADLELGLGIPAGTGCRTSVTVVTRASLTAQLAQSAVSGTYCVNIADTARRLTAPAKFSIRIVHP